MSKAEIEIVKAGTLQENALASVRADLDEAKRRFESLQEIVNALTSDALCFISIVWKCLNGNRKNGMAESGAWSWC